MSPYKIGTGDGNSNMMYDGGSSQESLDTKMTWRRRMGVYIFKNRGDVGPQKLYINPHLAPIQESYKHQRKFKRLFVNRELNFEANKGISARDSAIWTFSAGKNIDTSIRLALRPLLNLDFGNTKGIIEKYKFKHPVWINFVHDFKSADVNIDSSNFKSQPERYWQNCVIDWYEMKRHLELRIEAEDLAGAPLISEKLPMDPFTALRRIGRPRVNLFANGPMLDEESEFAYLTEMST